MQPDRERPDREAGASKSAGGRDTPSLPPPRDCSCGGRAVVDHRRGNVLQVSLAHDFDCTPHGVFGGSA